MNLFLSEEHIERWLSWRMGGGATALRPGSPHTRDQNAAILDRLELTGDS
jgi:hypothetical protein